MKVWVGTKVSTGIGGSVELGGGTDGDGCGGSSGGGEAGLDDGVAGAGASQGPAGTAVLVGE